MEYPFRKHSIQISAEACPGKVIGQHCHFIQQILPGWPYFYKVF